MDFNLSDFTLKDEIIKRTEYMISNGFFDHSFYGQKTKNQMATGDQSQAPQAVITQMINPVIEDQLGVISPYEEDSESNEDIKVEQVKNIKSFSCQQDDCKKQFKTKKSFKDHMLLHQGLKPFECNVCFKKFTQYSSWQKHLRVHTGQKPYKCQFENCEKNFTQISNLKRHEKIHTNEKPFDCPLCGKKFTSSSNLKQHQLIHEKENREKFRCSHNECEQQYFYQSSLKKHKKEEHEQQNNSEENDYAQPQNINEGMEQTIVKPLKDEMVEDEQRIQNMNEILYQKCCQQSQSSEQQVSASAHQLQCGGNDCSDFFQRMSREKQIKIHHEDHIDLLFMGYLYHFNKKSNQIQIHELETMKQFEMETEKKESDLYQIKEVCNPVSQITHNNSAELEIQLNTLQTKYPQKNFLSKQICSSIFCQCSSDTMCKACMGGSEKSVQAQQKIKQEQGKIKKQDYESSSCCAQSPTKRLKKASIFEINEDFDQKSCCQKNQENEGEENASNQEKNRPKAKQGCEEHQNKALQAGVQLIDQKSFVESQVEIHCVCQETVDLKHKHGPLCGHAQIFHEGHIDYLVENTLHHPHEGHCDYHGQIKVHMMVQNAY